MQSELEFHERYANKKLKGFRKSSKSSGNYTVISYANLIRSIRNISSDDFYKNINIILIQYVLKLIC